jgi:anion-transporting  ArsA/GET3 family ATPase
VGAAPANLLDRRLLFVTGKGGVGKTTIASALATLAAEQGRRTLVCEVDAKGNLGEFVGANTLRFQPREVHPGLFAMQMETEESLKEYLRLQLRVPLLSRLGPLARTFDFVATAAPGVKEILTIGKLAYEVRERNYDLVIVDASATGHVVGELASPVAMSELVRVGLVKQQTEWMIQILQNPATTGVVVVTTPEEMPVNETIDLLDRLDAETDIDVAAVIANRVLPELFSRGEEETFDRLDEPDGRGVLEDQLGEGAPTVLDAARLAVSLRRSSAGHLATLRERLPRDLPLLYVPYQFTRAHGMRTTRIVAEHLAQEVA